MSDESALAARILAFARHIDHPDHGENEEREDTCHECRKYAFGRAPWPCVHHRYATALRALVNTPLDAAGRHVAH